MPIDEQILVVSYSEVGDAQTEASALQKGRLYRKVKLITGEYKRTEPGCFRKEGGGKVQFLGGYWYLLDRLGQQVAWVEGGAKTVPLTEWQTHGADTTGESSGVALGTIVAMPIVVYSKLIDAAVDAEGPGPGCSEACAQWWANLKENIPHEHRPTVEAYEAKVHEHWPVVKEKAHQHAATAKATYDEYLPVAKEKGQEAYTACFDFWTHPDTQDFLQKVPIVLGNAMKACLAGCLTVSATLIDQAANSREEREADASYVKLDSNAPVMGASVMVEGSGSGSKAPLFLGDMPVSSPPPEDSNIVEAAI